VGSGKEYYCNNKACQKKLRKERGRWTSDACVLFRVQKFNRSALFAVNPCMIGSCCRDAVVEHFSTTSENGRKRK
jgi:hypothetical protein